MKYAEVGERNLTAWAIRSVVKLEGWVGDAVAGDLNASGRVQ